jgi:hypothetical protein
MIRGIARAAPDPSDEPSSREQFASSLSLADLDNDFRRERFIVVIDDDGDRGVDPRGRETR